jgi:hypothetical protein
MKRRTKYAKITVRDLAGLTGLPTSVIYNRLALKWTVRRIIRESTHPHTKIQHEPGCPGSRGFRRRICDCVELRALAVCDCKEHPLEEDPISSR